MIKTIQRKFSQNARKGRGELFKKVLRPKATDSILDLGGGPGTYMHAMLPDHPAEMMTIADILQDDLAYAKKNFQYQTAVLAESEHLPFSDQEFDIVFCNSVIEHVTLPKNDIWECTDTRMFNSLSFKRQAEFANEIRRISKNYFVQTPNKYFIIESHSWLPGFIAWIPRSMQIRLIRFFNKFWAKETAPDWHLLTYRQMQQLFPDATIYRERRFGFTKSLIAVKTATATSTVVTDMNKTNINPQPAY
ncbi:MAG: class I SAM-dependent methyltransferase [Saprospiraceae bacterium]